MNVQQSKMKALCFGNSLSDLTSKQNVHIYLHVSFYLHYNICAYEYMYIYSIICLKSVDVRTMQFVILAHSPREMSQTDRIHPRYFLLRVRVSIRPRYFVNAKKNIVHVCCLLRSAPLRPDEQLNSKP